MEERAGRHLARGASPWGLGALGPWGLRVSNLLPKQRFSPGEEEKGGEQHMVPPYQGRKLFGTEGDHCEELTPKGGTFPRAATFLRAVTFLRGG